VWGSYTEEGGTSAANGFLARLWGDRDDGTGRDKIRWGRDKRNGAGPTVCTEWSGGAASGVRLDGLGVLVARGASAASTSVATVSTLTVIILSAATTTRGSVGPTIIGGG
jgi:hypothetical protein